MVRIGSTTFSVYINDLDNAVEIYISKLVSSMKRVTIVCTGNGSITLQ